MIDKLHKNNHYDIAKFFLDQNDELVRQYLSKIILDNLDAHTIPETVKIGKIIDVDGPVTENTKEFAYFGLPKNSKIHLVDTEESVPLLDLLN